MPIMHDYDNSLFSIEDEMIKEEIRGTNESFSHARDRFRKEIKQNGMTTYWQVIGGPDAERKTIELYNSILKSGQFDKLNILFSPEVLKEAVELAGDIGISFRVGTSSPDRTIAEPMENSLAAVGVKMKVDIFGGTQAKIDHLLKIDAPDRRILIEDSFKIIKLLEGIKSGEGVLGVLINRPDNLKAELNHLKTPNVARAVSTDHALKEVMNLMRRFEREHGPIKTKSF
ncbi:MAG TPA: hypothetical protein VND15_01230 [Candidatus Acidoferrales bacterium]|nr:hypothetical protein [Candidatus Acidoferrales bacterium]